MQEREAVFTDYIHILIKWRKLVITNLLIVSVLAVVISLLLPRWYQATSLIMPPPQKDAIPGFSSAISQLPMSFVGLGMNAGGEELNLYMAILQSRTVGENVVKKFSLMDEYNVENISEAVETFNSNLFLEVREEGTISVSVLDKDQDQVHQITNFLVEELDRMDQNLSTQRAKSNRVFIEGRITGTEKLLEEAERRLKEFQEEHTSINIEVQTEEAIKAASQLKVNIMTLEVRLGVLENSVSGTHPELLKVRTELAELDKQYSSMRFGGDESSGKDIFPPFSEVPELSMEYARLLTDVNVQNQILLFLWQEYEQAKIQEAKDTPTVQIIDAAVRPERKARPRRALICLSSAFTAFFLTWIWIIMKEGREGQKKTLGQS